MGTTAVGGLTSTAVSQAAARGLRDGQLAAPRGGPMLSCIGPTSTPPLGPPLRGGRVGFLAKVFSRGLTQPTAISVQDAAVSSLSQGVGRGAGPHYKRSRAKNTLGPREGLEAPQEAKGGFFSGLATF